MEVAVANADSDSLTVIDPANLGFPLTIRVGAGPMGVAVDPGGKHVFVSNAGDESFGSNPDTVSVIDTGSSTVVTTLPPVGEFPAGLVATATNVYVAHTLSDTVSVIDL